MRTFLLVSILFSSSQLSAQSFSWPGARKMALAEAVTALPGPWSEVNAASLYFVPENGIGAHSMNLYCVNELNAYSLAAYFPLGSGKTDFGFSHLGYGEIHVMQYKLAYAHKLMDAVAGGIRLGVLSIKNPGLKRPVFMPEAGAGFMIRSEKGVLIGLMAAISVPDTYAVERYGSKKISVAGGFAWETEDFLLATDILWRTSDKFTFSFAAEVWLSEEFAIRTGVRVGNATEFSSGLGFRLGRMKSSLVSVFHPVLGISGGISLTFLIKTGRHD